MKNNLEFSWEKLGLVLNKLPTENWSKSHFQFPAVFVSENKIKVFITTRPDPEIDKKYVTYIRSFELDIKNGYRAINFSKKPILDLGPNGSFDQFGTMPGDIVQLGDKLYLFYTGWNRLDKVPYNFSVGLAISDDKGKTFKKYSEGPIIGQTIHTPYTCGSGAVVVQGGIFHQFCISGIKWIKINEKLEHTYTIKHAISKDGINWNFLDRNAINQKHEFEAIAAPTVFKLNELYHMWFSYRESVDFRGGKGSYRIGYAFSKDLIKWERDDERSGIDVSLDGWDSNMICYPYVFEYNKEIYMLYNGNDFGKDSLGIAKLNYKLKDA